MEPAYILKVLGCGLVAVGVASLTLGHAAEGYRRVRLGLAEPPLAVERVVWLLVGTAMGTIGAVTAGWLLLFWQVTR